MHETAGTGLSADNGMVITNSNIMSVEGNNYGINTGWDTSVDGFGITTIFGGDFIADGGIRAMETTPTLSNYIPSNPTVTASRFSHRFRTGGL